MKDLINNVIEKKMQDGTVEKIIADNFEKMVEGICSDQMKWNGAAKKAMEEKLNPLILEAVERSDLSSMVTKITMLINAALKGSEVESYHDVLASIKSIFDADDDIKALREKKVLKLSEIYERYKEYLQVLYDRDDFDQEDITDDGESVTAEIECSLQVVREEDYRGFSFGDSVNMELAKQMGAKALENLRLRFIMPKCESCGRYIPNVVIKHEGLKNESTVMMSRIEPWCCPHCHIEFICADIYPTEQRCILRGKEGEG